jgi:hypothetical protein
VPDPLEAELVLDTSSAMSQIDEIGTALQDAMNQAGGDVGGGAGGALEQTASGMDQVSESAKSASDSSQNLGSSLKGVEGVALLASGHVGGMRTAVQGFGAAAIPAVSGALALSAGMGELVQKGIQGEAATQRFNAILGDMAKTVSQVHVGDLNTSMDKLSITMGTVPSKTQQAAASIFQLGINSGLSKQQSGQFADQIVALAARSVALKPSLGDVGSVAEQMGTRLARGGVFAARLGVSLSQQEIAAKAASLGMGSNVAALNAGEKSYAAAQVAVDKYGKSLNEDIAKGSNNAEIQQRRFSATVDMVLEKIGAPLVSPFFALLTASLPAVTALGQALGALAQGAIPAITSAVQIVTPILQGLAAIFRVLGPAIGPITSAFMAYYAVTKLLVPGVMGLGDAIQSLGVKLGLVAAPTNAAAESQVALQEATLPTITAVTEEGTVLSGGAVDLAAYSEASQAAATSQEALAVSTETSGAGLGAMSGTLGRAAAGAAIGAVSFSMIGKSAGQSALGIAGMAASGAMIGTAFGPWGTAIGGAAGAVVGLTKALLGGGQSLEEYRKQFSDMGNTIDAMNRTDALKTFMDKLGQSDKLQLFAGYARGVTDEIKALGQQSPAAAAKVVAALDAMRDAGGKPIFDAKNQAELQKALGDTEKKLREESQATAQASAYNQQFTQSAQDQAKAEQDQAKAITDVHDAIVAQINSELALDDAMATVKSDTDAYNKTVQQYGASSQQATDAQRKLVESSLQAASAAATKAAAENGGIQTTQGATAANNAYVSQLQQVADEIGGPVAQQLEGYILRLGQLPTSIYTTIMVNTSQAEANLEHLISTFDHARSAAALSYGSIYTGQVAAGSYLNQAQTAISNAPPHKAEGGRVYPGTAYLVGERGRPEIFKPDVAGTIQPTFGRGDMPGGTPGAAAAVSLAMTFIVQGHIYGDSHLNEIVTQALDAQSAELARSLRVNA